MDDNHSLHSESVCSDDTEYLLGQNASIREIDDADLPPELPSIKTVSPKYGRQMPTTQIITRARSIEHHSQRTSESRAQLHAKHKDRSPLRSYDSNERLNFSASSQRSSKYVDDVPRGSEKRPKSPLEVNLEYIKEVGKSRKEFSSRDVTKQKKHLQRRELSPVNRGIHLEVQSSQGQVKKRKTSPVRNPEKGHREIHVNPQNKDDGTPRRNTRSENYEPNWRQPLSPYNNTGYDGDTDMNFETPEPADVGSVASEATEDLLHGDEHQLDGSIMEKLKQLNLAVNYDDESDEFYDDKVKEGAELLSKLFGGAVDNYYSSPSLSNSGHSKSSGSPGILQSGSKGEDRINLSNTSSKTGSYTSAHLMTTTQSLTSTKKKSKVSFATDESSSFDSSYRISSKGQTTNTKPDAQYGKSVEEEDRYRSSTARSEFVRETSALRAAMDYGNESEQHSSSFGQETSPSLSTGSQRERYGENVPKYNLEYDRRRINDEKDGFSQESSKSRYKVERYSDSSHGNTDIPAISPDHGRSQHEFTTSTPHRNRQQAIISPARSYQGEKEDLERKALFDKKLKDLEDKLSTSVQDLRDVEFDIEEAASRKKMALQEVHLLDDALKRTKADIKSSENIAEEYRQRATKTRSELMDLEVERDSTQQEIKDLSKLLERQKQETTEAIKVERKNERKALELTLERDKLLREIETSKTRLVQLEVTLRSEKEGYNDKITLLQEQLLDEQRSAKENIDRLKQQLENERQNARDSHFDRIQAIHKLQDEAKEIQEKEVEAVKVHMNREMNLEIDKVQEKARRETESVARKLQDAQFHASQLDKSLRDRQEETEHLKLKMRDEKEKVYDSEQSWKEALEKQEAYSRALKAEVDNLKIREVEILEKQRHLEEDIDEKSVELRRLDEKSFGQAEESSKILENKDDEIQMLRSLVRQQEDATRLLGEKMRSEAQEHIRSALKKERDSTEKERLRHNQKLDEMRDKYEDILRQVRADLEDEREGHRLLQNALHKMKMEMERFRQLHLQTQEDKVHAVAQLRSESKEHINRLKDKIEEITLVSDKIERDTVMEINEECRRVASLLGGSPNTTPIKPTLSMSSSFNGDSPGSTVGSPTRDALANLRSCNAELRQNLLEARKELEFNKNSPAKESNPMELTHQQIIFFKKALKSKDDEIARLKRKLQEETNKGTIQMRSERVVFEKTIDRLEKDLKEAKKSGSRVSSPMLNGLTSPPDNTNTSGLGTSLSSAAASPRTGDDTNTTKLLRHLQGRVQQLRAQNDSLRSDSLNDSQTSISSSADSFQTDREKEDESIKTKKLQDALQSSDQRAQKNAAVLSQKMMEMTKLQKMLTHATKENMKLERAYASLQRKVIDSST